MNIKIISGGQTGVDRAALDVAIQLGMPCGGFCPKGRKSEDGTIPEKYPLTETSSDKYEERTKKNVETSDGTLVIINMVPDKGTNFTISLCHLLLKPLLVVNISQENKRAEVLTWLMQESIKVLNVAGNRESTSPGIGEWAHEFLLQLFLSNNVLN